MKRPFDHETRHDDDSDVLVLHRVCCCQAGGLSREGFSELRQMSFDLRQEAERLRLEKTQLLNYPKTEPSRAAFRQHRDELVALDQFLTHGDLPRKVSYVNNNTNSITRQEKWAHLMQWERLLKDQRDDFRTRAHAFKRRVAKLCDQCNETTRATFEAHIIGGQFLYCECFLCAVNPLEQFQHEDHDDRL